jgi:hypothetical protein
MWLIDLTRQIFALSFSLLFLFTYFLSLWHSIWKNTITWVTSCQGYLCRTQEKAVNRGMPMIISDAQRKREIFQLPLIDQQRRIQQIWVSHWWIVLPTYVRPKVFCQPLNVGKNRVVRVDKWMCISRFQLTFPHSILITLRKRQYRIEGKKHDIIDGRPR